MKKLLFTVLTTVFFGCFLGKAQSILQASTPPPAAPFTPANSQLEIRGNKLITQNFQNIPTGTQFTGNFTTNSRWNSMGSLTAASQTLNGFRTQTDGRGLTMGYSIPNFGSVGNPTIQWIGSVGVLGGGLAQGNLEFRYADNPTVPGGDVPIFTMSPKSGSIPSFNYAEKDAFIGQLQSGTFGSFGGGDTWSATGQLDIPGVLTTYGSRHQYKGVTVNLGHIENPVPGSPIRSVLDFGNLVPSISTSQTGIFQFRTFTDPTNSSSIKNVWQSNNRFGNMVFGRQDYSAVNSANFYVSLFDGVASAASSTALNFVQKAGLYVTGDGLDQNNGGSSLSSYAAVVGDVSGVNLSSGSTKYAILGIADGSYTSGTSTAGNAAYFIGNVFYTGNLTFVSDKKFKKEINTEENIMPRLMQLQPKNYFFDVDKYKKMAFSDKLQHGLISQEVEKIFPELVEDAFAPNTSSDKKEDGKPIPYKGLNYMGLVPMLLKGLQEQQLQIEELKSKLETATSNTLVVTDKNSLPTEIQNKAFALSQNVPNPFSENTTISYTIPATAGKAILAVFDLNGKMLLQYNLQQGKNTIVVKGNTLTAGMYLYSLIADGQEVLSKRMVLTK